jgi:GNAT superfamily N-acetyltransferase
MTAVFQETNSQKSEVFDHRLWEWQYLRTEHPSLIVIAESEGRVVGYYHALTLAMRRQGRAVSGGLIQDVGTLAECRGQGVFREMGGYALQRFAQRGIDFVYGFPNERSRPSFERNHKYAVVASVPVYAMLLDPVQVVGARIGVPSLGRTLGRVIVPITRYWLERQARLLPSESVESTASVSDEIAASCQRISSQRSIHLMRSARFLTWRFLEKPEGGYRCWVLRTGGEPTAFVVSRVVQLFDLPSVVFLEFGCSPGQESALTRLLASRLAAEQREGALLGVTMGLHPFFRHLAQLGFLRVPERFNPRPFNLIAKNPAGTEGSDLTDPTQWLLTLSDWDVL